VVPGVVPGVVLAGDRRVVLAGDRRVVPGVVLAGDRRVVPGVVLAAARRARRPARVELPTRPREVVPEVVQQGRRALARSVRSWFSLSIRHC
jgi:hypothetical protein